MSKLQDPKVQATAAALMKNKAARKMMMKGAFNGF